MTRPPSIVQFERLYWASFVIGLANNAATWGSRKQILAANPMLANAGWFLPTVTVVSIAVAVTLWYFIVRSPSVVAKWFQVAFAAFGVLGILSSLFILANGTAPAMLPVVLGIVANLLYLGAAVMLFRADAKEWFGEDLDDDDDDGADVPPPRTEQIA